MAWEPFVNPVQETASNAGVANGSGSINATLPLTGNTAGDLFFMLVGLLGNKTPAIAGWTARSGATVGAVRLHAFRLVSTGAEVSPVSVTGLGAGIPVVIVTARLRMPTPGTVQNVDSAFAVTHLGAPNAQTVAGGGANILPDQLALYGSMLTYDGNLFGPTSFTYTDFGILIATRTRDPGNSIAHTVAMYGRFERAATFDPAGPVQFTAVPGGNDNLGGRWATRYKGALAFNPAVLGESYGGSGDLERIYAPAYGGYEELVK